MHQGYRTAPTKGSETWTTLKEFRANSAGRLTIAFAPLAVDALCLVIRDSNDHGYSRIVELEAYSN